MLYNIFTENETMIHYIKFDKAYVVQHIYNLLIIKLIKTLYTAI